MGPARLLRAASGQSLSMNKKILGIATTALVSGGLGLAGLGVAAGTAQAEPGPAPQYHWCPGDRWDDGWGGNWDWGRCHDDHFYDGEYRDRDHWHGGDYDEHWQGDQHWQGGNPGDHWQGGNPGDQDHRH
jgi:hypothetical protein